MRLRWSLYYILVQNQGYSSKSWQFIKVTLLLLTSTEFSEAKIRKGIEGLDNIGQLLLKSVKDNYSLRLTWTEAICS